MPIQGLCTVCTILENDLWHVFPLQRPSADPASKEASLIAVLQEMGFSNKLLNQKLLRKHQYNLLDVVNELVQMTDNEWYTTRH